MNFNDLSTIPQTQRGTIESINFAGNWLIRATGQPVPEPAIGAGTVAAMAGLAVRRNRRGRLARA